VSWSPMRPEDREHLDSFELTPELRREYAERARRLRDALGYPDPERIEESGKCDDCRRQAPARFRLGKFVLCRACVDRRRNATRRRR